MPWHIMCECNGTFRMELPFGHCPHCGREIFVESGEEPMPRQPLEDPPRKLTLSIPSSTLAQLELRLVDPVSLKTTYGALSGLMTSLIREWLSKQAVVNTALTPSSSEPSKEPNNGTA